MFTRKTKIILGILVALIIVMLIAFGFALSNVRSDGENLNPFKTNDTEVVIVDSEYKENQDKDKTEYNDEDIEDIDKSVLYYISSGDFTGLDNYLEDIKDMYRNETDPEVQTAINQEYIINSYRSDIVKYNTLEQSKNYDETLIKTFSTPEMALGAFIYLPLSKKIDGVVNLDSYILPAAKKGSSINIKEVPMDNSETVQLTSKLNTSRVGADKFVDSKIYTFSLYGSDCKVIMVEDTNYCWSVYSMEYADDTSTGITVDYLLEKRHKAELNGYDFDMDGFYTAE